MAPPLFCLHDNEIWVDSKKRIYELPPKVNELRLYNWRSINDDSVVLSQFDINNVLSSENENKSFDDESSSSGNDANTDIGPSYDSDTMTEVRGSDIEGSRRLTWRALIDGSRNGSGGYEEAILRQSLAND
ncbi:hypothetical protein Tco_0838426 [Tanacetum coccineum]|uniref:Uncharacterized protein n=1 Tax=Tanacetum coccineum TaxID=301880 RepID=A0ABQ5APJ6_9ASTR